MPCPEVLPMDLKRLYYTMVLPAVVLTAGLCGAREAGIAPGLTASGPFWRAALFTAAAVTAMAGPIFIRALFAHSVRDRHGVSANAFNGFQRRLILVSGITPYLAVTALFLNLPRFHASAIILMALYSLYYYYPSDRRINFDKRIFRVETR